MGYVNQNSLHSQGSGIALGCDFGKYAAHPILTRKRKEQRRLPRQKQRGIRIGSGLDAPHFKSKEIVMKRYTVTVRKTATLSTLSA